MSSLEKHAPDPSTTTRMARSFISILIAVANVDGLFTDGEMNQLTGGAVTFLKRRNITLGEETITSLVENPIPLTESLANLRSVPTNIRISVVEQAIALALDDGDYAISEVNIIQDIVHGLFSESEETLMQEYVGHKVKLMMIKDQLSET